MVQLAIDNHWTVTDPSLPDAHLGGSTVADQQAILDRYGIANDVVAATTSAVWRSSCAAGAA